jgi:hypothetical protein
LQVEIVREQEIFAKAIFCVEEIFQKDTSIADQMNKSAIFKRLISFLEKSGAQSSTIQTFKLIL